MSILIGTRKGLFEVDVDHPDASVIARHFVGVRVSCALVDPRTGHWFAALDHGHFGTKVHRSENRGQTWTELPAPAYPTDTDASTALLWTIEAGHRDQPGRLWCGTIPGGLFRSDDNGESWQLVRGHWDRSERAEAFGGGYDQPGVHSVSVHPDDCNTLVIGVSCGGIWLSTDDGTSWQLGTGLRASFLPPDLADVPQTQDPHRVVRCAAQPERLWIQHHNGIFRSNDGGRTWTEIVNAQPSSFGFGVAVHPADPDIAWFVPAISDEVRVPVDGRMSVSRTDDGGEHFQMLTNGLPQDDAYHLVYRHGLAVDGSGQRLILGSTSGSAWLSNDGGQQFQRITSDMPMIVWVGWAD